MKGIKFSFKRLFGIKQSNTVSGNSSSTAGPSTKAKNESHTPTLERLRQMEDLLQRKQVHLEARVEELISEAKRCGTKNKRAALMALRRKKRVEEELAKLDGTLTTIELQRESLEAAKNNVQVLGAMEEAANALRNAQKYVSVDKVLDIMDEVNEQQDVSKEISDAIANPLARMDATFDDAELEKELEEMEQEELNKALLQVKGSENIELHSTAETHEDKVDIPATDAKSQTVVIDPDEKELQELAQWSN